MENEKDDNPFKKESPEERKRKKILELIKPKDKTTKTEKEKTPDEIFRDAEKIKKLLNKKTKRLPKENDFFTTWEQAKPNEEIEKTENEPKREQTNEEKSRWLAFVLFLLGVLLFLIVFWERITSSKPKRKYVRKGYTKEQLADELGVSKPTFRKTIKLLYPNVMGARRSFVRATILPKEIVNKILRKFGMELESNLEIKDLLVPKSQIAKQCGTTTTKLDADIDCYWKKHRTYKKIGIHPGTYKQLNKLPLAISKKIVNWYESEG